MASLVFVFVCKIHCSITKDQDRRLVFEILTESKLQERGSDEFCVEFNVCEPKLKKQLGGYESEVIDNANMITITVNRKEYFEKYKDEYINKKHKKMREDAQIGFDACARRITSRD